MEGNVKQVTYMVLIPSQAMGFWGMFLVLVFLEKSWGQAQIYVSPAQIVFRVGVPENISLEAHGFTDALEATISVKSYPNEDISYSSGSVNLSPENNFQNYTILTIQAKQLSEGQNSYSYVYLEVMSKDFSKSEKVPIIYGNGSLLIHIDRPVYTPREPVKVAVYSLEDALAPVTRETVLTFIDPEGSEVGIVEGNNQTGVASFPDFNIPSNPIQGRWTVKAKYKDDASTTGTTQFEVEEHDKAYKITLMPASARPHRVEEQDEAHDVSVQPANSLEQMIEEKASKYKHPILKKCCYDGARYNHQETCEERAARVKIGPRCVKAFTDCCGLNTLKHFHLSMHHHQR